MAKSRTSPNIVVTGTPGTGKTTTCEVLAQETGLKHLDISRVAKDRECLESWDEELKTWLVDEDKLLDSLEDEVKEGGCILDWHACEPFPEDWVDLVVVLRAGTSVHYDRLIARGYEGRKLEENIDCEIMESILEEAKGAFAGEIVVELTSDTTDEMDANVERIRTWAEQWRKDRAIDDTP